MAVAFAAGATCCLIGPFPGYLALVGPVADSLTFFVGSLLFTAGGALTAGAACSSSARSRAWSAGTWPRHVHQRRCRMGMVGPPHPGSGRRSVLRQEPVLFT
jgi:hypothetical protein